MADLSIIVTAYNIKDYIEQCLESVAAQTLSDIEVLVVDDGSTDSTPGRITEFCAADPRFIPVLLPENSPGGVATAANAGLDRATGRWVGFVDGDDYVEPTMFERLVGAAAATSWTPTPAGYSSDLSPCPGASCTAAASWRTMRSGSRSATVSTRTTRSTGLR